MRKSIRIFLFSYLLCLVTGVAQENDSIKQPHEEIKVNRDYDEAGNLIRYDSIYSYSSSNLSLDDKKMDSIMKYFFSDKEFMRFNDTFEVPSFMFPNTFPNDFGSMDSIFRQHFENYQKYFDKIHQRYEPKKEVSPKDKI